MKKQPKRSKTKEPVLCWRRGVVEGNTASCTSRRGHAGPCHLTADKAIKFGFVFEGEASIGTYLDVEGVEDSKRVDFITGRHDPNSVNYIAD